MKGKMLNDDYKDMLQCLSTESVRFLVVGACGSAATLRIAAARTAA